MTIFANNVAGTLAANIGPSDTAILLGAGQGAAFPLPAGGEYFYATLQHFTTGVIEIVKCTSRSTDTLTVERGRDGTTATSFTTGSVIELRLVGIMLSEIDYRTVRGQANGLASLDGTTRIPAAQMPTTVPLLTAGKLDMAVIPDAVATDAEMALKANLSGATFSGNVAIPALQVQPAGGGGVAISVGNDVTIHDINTANHMGVKGASDPNQGFIAFGNGPGFGWNGVNLVFNGGLVWHQGNFDPNARVSKGGDHMSGDLFIDNGVLRLNAAGTRYLFNNGAHYELSGQPLHVGGEVRATDFIISSDRRLKKDINRVMPDPELSRRLPLREWTLRETGAYGRGVLAQDVKKYNPGNVRPQGKYLGVDKAGVALEYAMSLELRVQDLERELRAMSKKLERAMKRFKLE